MKNDINKLNDLCKPIVDFILQNYDPYTKIVISDCSIKVVKDYIGIPVNTKTTND